LEEKAEKAAEVVEKAGAAAHRMQSLVMAAAKLKAAATIASAGVAGAGEGAAAVAARSSSFPSLEAKPRKGGS